MSIEIIILGVLITIGFGSVAVLIRNGQANSDPHLKAELDRRTQEIGELRQQIEQLKSEKAEISTNGKNLFSQFKNMESDYKSLMKERDGLSSRVAKYEAEESRLQKKHEELIGQQEEVRKALEDERIRIRKEDEEEQVRMLAMRDRMWGEHEQNVIAALHDLTKKENCSFVSYSNTDLPDGWSGSLKPDFMIGFLKQYVIFDAKVSRSQDLQTYIKTSVQSTAKKVKGNTDIYRTVFLVVPTAAISALKQISFYEEGFHFYIISPEALEPILDSLKRIETYEFAEAMDPQERENIIDTIASFHFHIASRNAIEVSLMLHGLETLDKAEKMNPKLLAEAMIKKAKMRHLNISNTAETKEMVTNPDRVAQQLLDLVKPKAKISKKDLLLDGDM